MRRLPIINSSYWLALIAASVFGTNTGDFLSVYLHLGNVSGLPYLAVVLALIFVTEKFSPWASVVYFWAAIIVIRTAATNIADASHEFGIWGVGVILALVVGFIWAVRRYKRQSDTNPSDPTVPKVDGFYWVVMALAGVVGTLLGDISSAGLGFAFYGVEYLAGWTKESFSLSWVPPGAILATLIYGTAIFSMVRRYTSIELVRPYQYWTLLALIRTAGTAAGDYLATTPLQLSGATLADGAIFISLIFIFYVLQSRNQSLNTRLAEGR